jgi:hypothetical protein
MVAISKPAAKTNSSIGANLKTGVKTTGKSAKLLTAKIVKKPVANAASAVVPLPVNPDRFGPASTQSASNETKTSAAKKKVADGKAPRILPDGSTLVSSGKIAP